MKLCISLIWWSSASTRRSTAEEDRPWLSGVVRRRELSMVGRLASGLRIGWLSPGQKLSHAYGGRQSADRIAAAMVDHRLLGGSAGRHRQHDHIGFRAVGELHLRAILVAGARQRLVKQHV